MKILVVQDWLRSGGTERQSVFLANAFAAAGHTTTLLTFRPGGRLEPSVAPAVNRRALQPFDFHLDWFAPGLNRFAGRLDPDVILCMGRMANCHAGLLQRRNPRSTVLATMRTGKALPRVFQLSLRDVQHVVANSCDARDLLVQRYHVPPKNISVIYNSLIFAPAPADTSAPTADSVLTKARTSLRRRYGATDSTLVLLCVAMFRPEKNQRELIEIVRELSAVRCQLWLAGDGPARRECEQGVAHYKLSNRVKFVGFQPNPTELYAAADVAVHASWSESLSNFLIEAQAAGLPAVAYKAQGIGECFIPDVTGWAVEPYDRPAFRQRLISLANDTPASRAERAEKARQFARTTFDPQRQVEAYLQLFEQLRSSSQT